MAEDEMAAFREAESGGCGSAVPHPDVGLPEMHQWLEITGHWADPAAEECRVMPLREQGYGTGFVPGDSMRYHCRTKFVATTVTPAPAP
jgi:hypothetical protein